MAKQYKLLLSAKTPVSVFEVGTVKTAKEWGEIYPSISEYDLENGCYPLWFELIPEEQPVSELILSDLDIDNIKSIIIMKKKTFIIITKDQGTTFNFLTEARDNKGALRNFINRSSDFKNIVNPERKLTITVREVK